MITLKESIEIDSSPEEIFEWFRNLDKNYTAWHSDHVKWVFKGRLEEGARCQYEEILHGDLHKARAMLIKVEDNRLIEFRHFLPISVVCPGGSFVIEQKENGSLFTATLDFRFGWLFSTLAGRKVGAVKRHMREESQNLKRILEGRASVVEASV